MGIFAERKFQAIAGKPALAPMRFRALNAEHDNCADQSKNHHDGGCM
jgi:hypothetical protein